MTNEMNGFTIVDGTLTKYDGPELDILVPAEAKKIDAWCLYCPVTSLIIPEGVQICDHAFFGSDATVFYDKKGSWVADCYLQPGNYDDTVARFEAICKCIIRTDNGKERSVFAHKGPWYLSEEYDWPECHQITFPKAVVWIDTNKLDGYCNVYHKILVKNATLLGELLRTDSKLRESLLAGSMDQLLITPEMLDDPVLLQEEVWKMLLDYARNHGLTKVESLLMKKHTL